jgi:choline dehydrogenase-like flavoprotein
VEPYFTKSESYVSPSSVVEHDLETQYIQLDLHGKNGPIENTFPDIYGPLDEAWPRTYAALGLSVKSDPRDGLALGGYTNIINMDLKIRTRSYAATGYYLPAAKRPNLTVMTGSLVQKILFTQDISTNQPVATGVQYIFGNKTVMTVKAKKEVILSAGSIGSPHILELSGIGDRDLLEGLKIDIVFANSNVGENLQDHAYIPIG